VSTALDGADAASSRETAGSPDAGAAPFPHEPGPHPRGHRGEEGRVAPAGSLRGSLRLPADKSIAHRALIFNALAAGGAEVELHRPGADVRSTADALAVLGAVTPLPDGADGSTRYRVAGGGTAAQAGLPGDGGEVLDCGNSGTTMRLLAGALAGRPGAATLTGDESLSRRPMQRVALPLRLMGADIETTEGHAPVTVRGARPLLATEHRLSVASAQVLGAVSLAALGAQGRTTIEVPGPTRDHTERLLAWLGADIRRDGSRTSVEGPAGFRARSLRVPGDISSAAAWLVAGALHPDAEIELRDVSLNPSRLGVVEVLREMGADIEIRARAEGADAGPEPAGDIVVRGGRPLEAIRLAGARVADVIDELPLLGVAMAAASGTSELRDASELRVKESDRIALVVRNLRAIGTEAEELPDGWRVRAATGTRVGAGPDGRADIVTGGDHRIAISFAVAALTGVAREVRIDDPGCVEVSYASFWDDLRAVAR
jgi:3-phosphoshikimate 1-carboxyvinyltransferase